MGGGRRGGGHQKNREIGACGEFLGEGDMR